MIHEKEKEEIFFSVFESKEGMFTQIINICEIWYIPKLMLVIEGCTFIDGEGHGVFMQGKIH